MNVKKVRVFSSLPTETPSLVRVYNNKIFKYCLTYGQKNGIEILIENEPICNIFTLNDVIKILKHFPSLNLWLDVANIYQIGEKLDEDKLAVIMPRTRHIHLKDFVWENNHIKAVPLGKGSIPWDRLLKNILNYRNNNISLSIETHVQENKLEATEESIKFFRNHAKIM